MPEKFDIYSKIFYRDVEKFVRHLCLLVLRHQMRVSNYFVNSFYSVASHLRLGLTIYRVHVGSSSKVLNATETTTLAWD